MEKRTLLAIVISLVILLVWDFFYIQPNNPKNLPKEPPKKEAPAVQKPSAIPVPIQPQAQAPIQAGQGQPVVIETPLYKATWSTQGAALTSFKLKKYRESIDSRSKIVDILFTPMPVIGLNDRFDDSSLIYAASDTGQAIQAGAPREIVFSAQAAPGIVLKKIYTIDPATYTLGYRLVVENNTGSPMSVDARVYADGVYPSGSKASGYSFEGPVLLIDKHLEEFKISKVENANEYRDFPGNAQWFGFEDKYFLRTIIPQTPVNTSLKVKRINEKVIRLVYDTRPATVQPGKSMEKSFLIFMGPKEIKTLKTVGYGLNKALNFGFFDIIAKPLLVSMNWIYKYTLSYGLSIILLTIVIKFLLYPLTLKSIKSMRELQKIQPLMKEIQARYKDDKQKLNQELMKLYSEHKINPMGGCLPMLLQIPILFALYKVFYAAIELRHTPFHIVGTWLPDLSEKDPYYITPILMGVSQFIMQKMSPAPGDATQQKMMLIMPFFLTILFVNFPSGLVLYWLVSNILSIFQQAYINRKHT